jgi:hypothetical protein
LCPIPPHRGNLLVRIAIGLLARAGWAPAGVFALHLVFARILGLYGPFPHLDMLVHTAGGIAGAYFLARCFAAVPEDVVTRRARASVGAVAVLLGTSTVAVFWEFYEWICDHAFHSRMQGGLADTLLDIALGISGAGVFVAFAWRNGSLSRIDPLDLSGTPS